MKKNSSLKPVFSSYHRSILSVTAATNPTPTTAAPRHMGVSLAATALELLVPTAFPFKPQVDPKHGKVDTAVVVVEVLVIKNPCWS